jgi:Flp pilus assembly protein TadG
MFCVERLNMSDIVSTLATPQSGRRVRRSLWRNEDGATAVEFAIISVPFITLLLGIISVCVYFFQVLEVENAVWQGSRDLRVGNYQQGLGRYASKTGDTLKNEFRNAICEKMRDNADCLSNMRVLVQSYAGFGSVTQPSCVDAGGNLVTSAAANAGFSAGGASSVVLVTGCYRWQFGGKLPFFNVGNMPDGSRLVQSSYTFRTEPYN